MADLKGVLEKILLNQYDFCCLCFNFIGQADKFYHIYDEIVFNKINNKSLFEVLSCAVGSEVLKNLTSSILVCQVCTERVIESYKFIMECRKKYSQLRDTIQNLNNYFDYNVKETKMYKSVILSLNSKHITDYYAKSELVGKPLKILKILKKVSANEPDQKGLLISDLKNEVIDQDADMPNENNAHHLSKDNNEDVKLTDIILDKNNPSIFKCKICHNNFSRAPNLKKHYYSVHAPKVFKCQLCPKSFGSAILLKTHSNHHHCAAVCCTECGKMYSSVYSLESHEKRHRMRHVCQHCGKVYKTKNAFKMHLDEFHYGFVRKTKAQFICDYCGKKYSQKSAIRVHIKFEHENGKFYECEWCKKKFSSVSRLKEHIITHTKEKRFSCEVCGGRFATKMSLLYHTRTHTGERPYQCQHCDSSFLSASRRMTHVKQHHMPAAQECDVCNKKFKLRSYLLKHRQRHFDPSSKLHHGV